MIFTIFSFLSEVLSSGIHLEAASLSDSLSDVFPGLIDLQLDARASSTVLKYKSGWSRWSEWHGLFWALRSFQFNVYDIRIYIYHFVLLFFSLCVGDCLIELDFRFCWLCNFE